jgi:hypothetical protein
VTASSVRATPGNFEVRKLGNRESHYLFRELKRGKRGNKKILGQRRSLSTGQKMEAEKKTSETTTTTTTTTTVGDDSSVTPKKWDLLAVKRLLTSVESSLDDHRQVLTSTPPPFLSLLIFSSFHLSLPISHNFSLI